MTRPRQALRAFYVAPDHRVEDEESCSTRCSPPHRRWALPRTRGGQDDCTNMAAGPTGMKTPSPRPSSMSPGSAHRPKTPARLGRRSGGAPRGRRAVRVYSPSSAETHCKGLHRPHDRSARNHICATAGDDQAAAALRLGAAQRLPRGRSKRCRKGHGRLSGDAIQSSDPHETNGRIRQLLTPAEYGTCGEVRGQQRRTRSLKRSYTG
jgi:hypothetical protein